jgi:hypothetical protein
VGWDAYACTEGVAIEDLPEAAPFIEAFKTAAELVMRETAACDGGLLKGALFNSWSRDMLTKATGALWYGGESDDNEYSPEQIREFARNADWDFGVASNDMGSYRSAQEFLRICAENNLGVYISF